MSLLDYVNLGLDHLSVKDLHSLANDYATQIKDSLEGKPTTLEMIPAQIAKKNTDSGSGVVLAIDIGGSKVRLAFISRNGSNQEVLTETQFEFKGGSLTIDEYSSMLVSKILEFYQTYKLPEILGIGFVFSFPAKIIQTNCGTDVSREGYDDEWGKDFLVKDSNINITRQIRNELEKKGFPVNCWVSMNDVTALLYTQQDSNICFVAGTGFNLGININGSLYNTESGFFSSPLFVQLMPKVVKKYFAEVEAILKINDEDPGQSLHMLDITEVQVGGLYLYRLLILAMLMLGDCDNSLIIAINRLESKALTMALTSEYESISKECDCGMTPRRFENLKSVSALLRDRAADIVSFQIAGALQVRQDVSDGSHTIVANGSLIEKLPGFKERIVSRVKEIWGYNITIATNDEAPLIGAANACFDHVLNSGENI